MAQELRLHSPVGAEPVVYQWPLTSGRGAEKHDGALEIIETIRIAAKKRHNQVHYFKVLTSCLFEIIKMNAVSKDAINEVIFETVNNKGIITLNRPKCLNTYIPSMIKSMLHKLVEWENEVDMVIIKGEGRAFCAGGDVVTMLKPDSLPINETAKNTYSMNALIGQYQVPYVAIIDGITMGGGAGLSVHGQFRIATENTAFSMPETKIGYFNDTCVSYVFSRMPHHLGHFLGLTGYILKGADVVKAGIATHYVKSENIKKIIQGLLELNEPDRNLTEFLLKNTEDVSGTPFSLAPYLTTIDKAFSASTVEEIIKRLRTDKSEFALKIEALLYKMSPISLKVSKRLFEIAKNKTIIEIATIENRLSAAFVECKVSQDSYTGVTALLVDKNKKPDWNPATLEDVTDEMLDSIFDALPHEEELHYWERINGIRRQIRSNI